MMSRSLFAIVLALVSTSAAAQEQGIPEQGRAYADKVCAECHLVTPEVGLSPMPGVKSFKEIANRPGMSAMALGAWMQSEHESMPHIVPAPDELNDVIAYIVSLKE